MKKFSTTEISESYTREGRIRYLTKSGTPAYDYFVKDHLGNVRLVLTDEKDTTKYPMATFEEDNVATEQNFYDNVDEQRTSRPGAFYTSTTNGNKVQLLRKSVQSKGVGQLLKVMSGDKIHVKVDYYIPTATTNNSIANGLNTIIDGLAFLIDNSKLTTAMHGSGNTITTNLENSIPFTDFFAPQNDSAGTTMPKAYLNIVFFDEQFKFVSENSEAIQVTTEGSGQTIYRLDGNAKEAAKNGYVYIYVNNESDNLVYFDNLQTTHEKGPLLEESHYYPFGTEMAGISSRSLPSYVPNRYKANAGAEYGDGEWSNGSGLEMYETFYRSYNAQIGRFMQGDPKMEESMESYVFASNNPVMFTDLMGDLMDPRHYSGGRSPSYWRSNFYSYMDRMGNKWHHADVLAGTALEGIPYIEGWGIDGFGTEPENGGGDGSDNRKDDDVKNVEGGISYSGEAAKETFENILNALNGNGPAWIPGIGYFDGSVYPEDAKWVKLEEVVVDFQPIWHKDGKPGDYVGGSVQNWTSIDGGKMAIWSGENGQSVVFQNVKIINRWVMDGYGYTTSNGVIHADKTFRLSRLQHEYGHFLQVIMYGAATYNGIISPSSLYSMVFSKNHDNFWTEKDANAWATLWFGKNSAIGQDNRLPKEFSYLLNQIINSR